jgi:EAL domain-containing protein (putative c-di-GMP-specific phosphodiesterase class I)
MMKIDNSYIGEIPQQEDDREIAAAIITIGHTLRLKVLAEGVETSEQLDFLRAQGCDLYQGYFNSLPVPALDFEGLFRQAA